MIVSISNTAQEDFEKECKALNLGFKKIGKVSLENTTEKAKVTFV